MAATPLHTAADYLAAAQSLLPQGRAWPRDPGATLTAVLSGITRMYERIDAEAIGIIRGAFPATAEAMLPEWEQTLGLPGLYGVTPSTTAGRQAAVVAALTDTGGQSVGYFTALAAALGVPITVTEYSVHTVNASVATAIASDEWASVWRVTAPASAAQTYAITADVVPMAAGRGNPLLDAILGKHKPAHTVVLTDYSA